MTSWGRGKYGQSGGQAVAARLDAMVPDGLYYRSSPHSDRGFEARLRYVLEHRGGGEALHAHGVRPDVGRVVGWLTGDIKPRRSTREGVDAAYREMRRENVARSLKGRLAGGGRGTRVTVEPLPPAQVPLNKATRQNQFETREVTVRPDTWRKLVDAWEEEDYDTMDDVWIDDVASDMGSPPEAYYEVAHVGFSA